MVKDTKTVKLKLLWTNCLSVFDHVMQACNFIKKESLAQVVSYKFCEIFQNTFSNRTPPVAASEVI